MRRRDLSKSLIACATGLAVSSKQAAAATPIPAERLPRSAEEIAAQVTPKDLGHAPGNVLRYGADPTGDDDSSAAFLDARKVATRTQGELLIPGGRYRSDATLEWGFESLSVRAAGDVTITFTKPGRCITIDGGEKGRGIYGVQIEGKIRVVGNAGTTDAWFVRACHHSKLQLRAGDCATALRTQWCVLTHFEITCSVNEGAFTRLTPSAGIVADQRDRGETTASCTFNVPTLEGIAGIGIDLQATLQCAFIGGSSEGNRVGVRQANANNVGNTLVGMDFEANKTQDLVVTGGSNLTCININSLSNVRTANIELEGGDNTTFVGGFLRWIEVHASASGTALFATQVADARGVGIQGLGKAATFGVQKVDGHRVVTMALSGSGDYAASAIGIALAMAACKKLRGLTS